MCGMEVISLWHCWGTTEPSACLDCCIDCFSSFFWKYQNIFHMGFRSGMLAGQSSTVTPWSANHMEVVLALWAGAEVLLEKETSISIKLVSRWKHKVLQNILVDGCIDFRLDKTQWTNTSRRHGTPHHPWLQKLHTGLQAAWILCLSSIPPDSRPWFPNEILNVRSSEKRTLDHWEAIQFFFYFAQVRCFWRCFCFRRGLVALFLKMSERGDSWCTHSSFSSLLVKLSQVQRWKVTNCIYSHYCNWVAFFVYFYFLK